MNPRFKINTVHLNSVKLINYAFSRFISIYNNLYHHKPLTYTLQVFLPLHHSAFVLAFVPDNKTQQDLMYEIKSDANTSRTDATLTTPKEITSHYSTGYLRYRKLLCQPRMTIRLNSVFPFFIQLSYQLSYYLYD